MKILIVDDEPPARARLFHLIHDLGLGEVVGEAGNGHDALVATDTQHPDVVLLDIRMPGMDGLEVARHLSGLESPPSVIFTTAYDDHALAAFETNAIDYLLKPIRRERLTEALGRVVRPTRAQLSGLQESVETNPARTHLSATLFDRLQLVPVAEVRYLKAEHKYVTVGHPDGQLLIEDSLSSLEEEFADRFLRVHRNALIATVYARGLGRDEAGRNIVHLADVEAHIEVSRRMVAVGEKGAQRGSAEKLRRLSRDLPT